MMRTGNRNGLYGAGKLCWPRFGLWAQGSSCTVVYRLLQMVWVAIICTLGFAQDQGATGSVESAPLENRAAVDYRDHEGVNRSERSEVVTVTRAIQSLRAQPAVLPELHLALGSTMHVPIALIGTGTQTGRYRVSITGGEAVQAVLIVDPGCAGTADAQVGSSELRELAVEPESSACALLRLEAVGSYSVGTHRFQVQLIEVSPEGETLGVALVLDIVVTVWGIDPVSGAVIVAEVLTNPVRYGGVLALEVEVRNPSSAALVGELELIQPVGTRTFAAELVGSLASQALRALSTVEYGSATKGGWRVPLTIAGNGSQKIRFYSRVLLGAKSPMEASFTLTSTREQGTLEAVAAVSVAVEIAIDDRGFARDRATLMGQALLMSADGGLSEPAAGVRVLLPDGRQTLSDARGRFAFPEVPRGWLRVQIDPHSLPTGASLELSALDPFGQWLYVDGLTWLQVTLRPAGASATSAGDPTPDATPSRGPAWLVAADEVTLRADAVPLIFRAPLGVETVVLLNDEVLPADVRGVVQIDLEQGEQRVELAGISFPVGVNTLELVSGEERASLLVRVPGEPEILDIEVLQSVADALQPIEVLVRVSDRYGTPTGSGELRVVSDLALDPAMDARPESPGIAIELEDGEALVRFLPRVGGGSFPVTVSFAGLESRVNVVLSAGNRNLWTYQGTFGVAVGERLRAFADARAYLELDGPLGSLQLALDAGADWDRDGLQFDPGFAAIPEASYPVTGVSSTATRPLESDDGIAFRYQRDGFSVAYERGLVEFQGIGINAFGSAARATLTSAGGLRVEAIAGRVAGNRVEFSIEPDGTRRYPLPYAVVAGSEQVVLVTLGDEGVVAERRLRPDLDYVVQSQPPTLVLVDPIWPRYDEGNAQRLDLEFVSPEAPRDTWVGGLGWSFTQRPWFAYASVAQLPQAGETATAYAAGVRFSVPGLNLSAGLEQRGTEALRVRIAGDTRWQHPENGLELRAAASWLGGDDWRASASARMPLAEIGSAALTVERGEAGVKLAAAFTARLAQVDLGSEVSYSVAESLWRARVSAATDIGRLRVGVAHVHSFGDATTGTTSVRLEAPITSGLSARLNLRHEWNQATYLETLVLQRVGISQWELGVTGSDEEPWSTRLSVRVPLQLWEGLRLDIAAGASRSWVDGAAASFSWSSNLSYRIEGWSANLSFDANYQEGWQKRLLSANVRGDIADAQTLRADLSLDVDPELRARFSVGYALHLESFNLLAQQSLVHSEGATELEGRADANVRIRQLTSLRPRLAYRFSVDDPESLTLQAGFGVTHALTPTIGVGVVGYLGWLPALGDASLAGAVEVSFEIAKGLMLVGGYTFGGGPALLPGSEGGLHIRFEVFGGTR